jgi:hypothetical protein
MLRVSPRIYSSGFGDQKDERIIMGNLGVAEELLGSDELEELYKLSASESDPEDDDDDDDDDGDGDEDDAGQPHE